MNLYKINELKNEQYQITKEAIHKAIASKLGVKELYTESNLFCEVISIDSRTLNYIAVEFSTSCFSYKLTFNDDKVHEILDYTLKRNINTAPDYTEIKIGDLVDVSIFLRGKLETAENVLRAILKSRDDIHKALMSYVSHDYSL